MGVTYKTAFRWWKAGKLDAYQLDTGTVSDSFLMEWKNTGG
jgi:predicted site-specific integrase-resolvase